MDPLDALVRAAAEEEEPSSCPPTIVIEDDSDWSSSEDDEPVIWEQQRPPAPLPAPSIMELLTQEALDGEDQAACMAAVDESKVEARYRKWAYTLNNPTDEEVQLLLEAKTKAYAMQHELAPRTGTRHLQGCIWFENARTFQQVKKLLPRAHWSSVVHWQKCVDYCTKEATRDPEGSRWTKGVLVSMMSPMIGLRRYAWQDELLGILRRAPHPRKIYWYTDAAGNAGKTTLSKHLVITQDAFYFGGASKDVLYACTQLKQPPQICILDLPRSRGNTVDYDAIESLKNGIFFAGKYESRSYLMPTPHVVVFANENPDLSKLSADRWEVHTAEAQY